MVIRSIVYRNRYFDSLFLLRIGKKLMKSPGVIEATAMMGTSENKASIRIKNLLTEDVNNCGPNDLFIVVSALSEKIALDSLNLIVGEIDHQGALTNKEKIATTSLEEAMKASGKANLALISIPGEYVKTEAMKALRAGLNLFIFSDNVPIEDELEIKRSARDQDLLVMGPDCGTSILNGVAIGFANKIRRGSVGLVAASGTGLQEVSCLIDRLGYGVSQAIGTGSRDISNTIGAISMIFGLELLERDPATDVIIVVSKPPSNTVAKKLVNLSERIAKPVVLCFIGGDHAQYSKTECRIAETLEEAAILAVEILSTEKTQTIRHRLHKDSQLIPPANNLQNVLSPRKYIRGLFCGGTFAAEAAVMMREKFNPIYANFRAPGISLLPDPLLSKGHVCIDLGDDLFTNGRPHPMLEPSIRNERLITEASDPEVAVILVDVVLGYGSHRDPANELIPAVNEAFNISGKISQGLSIVANVCGVDADPQRRSEQVQKLHNAGVQVTASSSHAVRQSLALVE